MEVNKKSEIPVGVKVFLRSVLTSAPGIEQSKICKEYKDLTKDILPYANLGYKDLYMFLVALEGEVTRLEFSPKHQDNIVYAVLDNSKFSSGHAKKFAQRSCTGLKHKNPDELKQWKRENGTGQASPPFNQPKSSPGPKLPSPVNRKEMIPTKEQWLRLSQLTVDRKGMYCVRLSAPDEKKSLSISKAQVMSLFSRYGCESNEQLSEVQFKCRIFVISLPSYWNAYCAWRDLNGYNCSGELLQVEPSINKDWKGSSYQVRVERVPYKYLLMGTFVKLFASRWKDLQNITARFHPDNDQCSALLYFRSKTSANSAKNSIKFVMVEQKKLLLTLTLVNTRGVSSSSVERTTTTTTATTADFLSKNHLSLHSQSTTNSLLPTPPNSNLLQVQTTPYNCSLSQVQTTPPNSNLLQVQTTPYNCSLSQVQTTPPNTSPSYVHTTLLNNGAFTPKFLPERGFQIPSQKLKSPSRTCERLQSPPGNYMQRRCGFCVDYEQANDMFKATCKRSARTCRNVADQIDFLVVHFVDGCRFWILLAPTETNRKCVDDMLKIEENLACAVEKIQASSTLPKAGTRGAAVFHENRKWYRCFVLSSDEQRHACTVLFVDYGNVQEINAVEDFRLTHAEFWKLPPQAIPCKIHGIDMNDQCTPKQIDEAKESLRELISNDVLRAIVVKNSGYSQPHVVELKNIRLIPSQNPVSMNKILLCKHLQLVDESYSLTEDFWSEKSNSHMSSESSANQSSIADQLDEKDSSLFPYKKEDLIYGMVAEVNYSCSIYLYLGDMDELAKLELQLQEIDIQQLQQVKVFTKGAVLLKHPHYKRNNETRRRVTVCEEIDSESNKVKVLHVDHGEIEYVSKDCLYHLDKGIEQNNFQARPVSLAGIQYDSIQTANSFLKPYAEHPVRANVIKEYDDGQLAVELFDVKTQKSLNMELVLRGLAHRVELANHIKENYDNEGDHLSACVGKLSIAAASDEKVQETLSNKHLMTRSVSSCSWKSNTCFPPHLTEPSPPLEDKFRNTKLWVEDQVHQKRNHVPLEDKPSHRPQTPPFPPPHNIFSSGKVISKTLAEGIRVEGNRIYIGNDMVTLDSNNRLVTSELDNLREKWRTEREHLAFMKRNLENMVKMEPNQLKEAFKEKKKRKLQLLLKLKDKQEELKQVQAEYDQVVGETDTLLAAV